MDAILNKSKLSYQDFLQVLSAPGPYLFKIVQRSRELTLQRFGRTIQFYVPLYLSNECDNACVYCGFNKKRLIDRKTLTPSEIEDNCRNLKQKGFDQILLLTGESLKTAGVSYLLQAVSIAKKYFSFVGLEVFPMTEEDYGKMVAAGADGLTLYQETYHRETYKNMHPEGSKQSYEWRFKSVERALKAGFRKVGMGVLLGLYDWRFDVPRLAQHAINLQKKYWRSEFTFSFPRLNPLHIISNVPHPVSDRDLLQIICSMRLFFPEAGLVLSTRERSGLRDELLGAGITQISAGSRTSPGAYALLEKSGEQFAVSDTRELGEMLARVIEKGYDPVIKDWELDFAGVKSCRSS
ncbi:MAG: 2-iminoacetate synthase ThiH [Candidatus Aureabacteria bacterium]|nr:2-iminoacetate synthase ThiH [Candidatus Auribacterota bacterium]